MGSPEAAHAVEESAGAAFAVASQLGTDGQQLADAARDAFATGLGDALMAGAVIAILTAAFTLWRAPRRTSSGLSGHVVEAAVVDHASSATASHGELVTARS